MNEMPAPSATAVTMRSSSGSARASGGQGGSPQTSRRTSRQAPGTVVLRPPDERLAPQIGGADGGAAGQPMPSGQDAHHRLAPEPQLFQAGLLEGRADETDVDLAGVQLFDVQHRRPEAEHQLDLRIAGPEGRHDLAGHPTSERAGEAHAQPSPLAGAGRAGPGGGAVGASEQIPGLGQQRAAGRRERGSAPVALEQRHAELGLQGSDLLAHARLGEMEPIRGAPEVELLRHRDERPQLP